MEHTVLLAWKAPESEYKPKAAPWYWAVGIASAGIAIAASIVQNYLFALIAILGGFAVMVVGSRRPPNHLYKLTDRGIMVGTVSIPYSKMIRFAIRETDQPMLFIETKTVAGLTSIPLGGTDWRRVKMELKNQDVPEVEHLGVFIESIERALGL